MARFSGVLIDLWGTLAPVSPRKATQPHLEAVARLLGADPPRFEEDWRESIGERCIGALGSLEETIGRIPLRQGCKPTEAAIREAVGVRLDFHRAALDASQPILQSLDELRKSGLRLAIVTDTTEETPRLWDSVPLGARFDASVFSCRTGFCKPDPRMYRLALERLGLSADECAYVGDGDSRELTGARSVGLTAFLYRFPSQLAEPEYRQLPDVEWNGRSLTDLRELLGSIES